MCMKILGMLSNLEKQTIVYENESKDTKTLLVAFEQRLNQQKLVILQICDKLTFNGFNFKLIINYFSSWMMKDRK